MSSRQDRGLRAVERVRGLREEAARRELLAANTELVAARQLISATESEFEQLSSAPVPTTGGGFAHRQMLTSMVADTCTAARQIEAEAAAVTAQRTDVWRKARTDQAAIANLLERRAAARRAEARVAEQKQLDELAGRRAQREWGAEESA